MVRAITPLSRDSTQIPSARLMHAVATWLSTTSPTANGAATPATVASPMIQEKNIRGRGVTNAVTWATPVATRVEHEGREGVVAREPVDDVDEQRRANEAYVEDVADQDTDDGHEGGDAAGGHPSTPEPAGIDLHPGPADLSHRRSRRATPWRP